MELEIETTPEFEEAVEFIAESWGLSAHDAIRRAILERAEELGHSPH